MDQEEIDKALKSIVEAFIDALEGDVFPHDEVGLVFGVHAGDGKWARDLASSQIGLVMFGLWQTLITYRRLVTARDLERELEQGSLPQYCESIVRSLSDEHHSKYTVEVLRRGFGSIEWDIQLHNVFRRDRHDIGSAITLLPDPIREYAHSLPPGMYTPLPYPNDMTPGNIDFVAFVGNTDDSLVRDLDENENPIVEIRLGVRSREGRAGTTVVLAWLFLFLEGSSGAKHLFEMGFNIGEPVIREHFNTLSRQPFYEIVTCGQSAFTVTRVELPSLGSDMSRVLALAQRHLEVGWSQEEYVTALQDEWAKHPDIHSLVEKFAGHPTQRFEDIL